MLKSPQSYLVQMCYYICALAHSFAQVWSCMRAIRAAQSVTVVYSTIDSTGSDDVSARWIPVCGDRTIFQLNEWYSKPLSKCEAGVVILCTDIWNII